MFIWLTYFYFFKADMSHIWGDLNCISGLYLRDVWLLVSWRLYVWLFFNLFLFYMNLFEIDF